MRALARGAALLDILSREPSGLGLTEIARRASLGFSTCHRLLGTLVGLDYVVQDPDTGRYLLGFKVLELASRAGSDRLLLVRARPLMTETMRASGETTNLAVRDGSQARYVAQVPSNASVRMFAELGSPAPLHATGVGKVLLAHAPQAVVDAVLAGDLAGRTTNTLTTPRALRAALAAIRANGFAVDDEEFENGVTCVAAPVRNHALDVVAALSVAGPSGRVAPALERLTRLVIAQAAALSAALGAPRPETDREVAAGVEPIAATG
ncbi:MAG TPA: IclR family transcriptional regulator [Candidatus Limnocylindrales bacterium]|nr:IclR family transcriptional regulator [Candidatus Limnocylindrales bacterium]